MNAKINVFKNGLLTGLILQLAIGPVFFFIVNLALQKSIADGFIAIIGVTIADYIYIMLSIQGIGKLLSKKKIRKIFGFVSSIVLIVFGAVITKGAIDYKMSAEYNPSLNSLFASFASAFFLTISNPLTIILFTSLFAAKSVEYGYSRKNLFIFGFGTLLATPIFMGLSVIVLSLIKNNIPTMAVQILNLSVGFLLIVYGGIRLAKVLRD